MDIQHKDDGKKGAFFVMDGADLLAEMSYIWAGDDRIIIDHTEVSEVLKGKGVGKQMVIKSVEFAREKGIKIVPLCPFAKSVFERSEELRDVL